MRKIKNKKSSRSKALKVKLSFLAILLAVLLVSFFFNDKIEAKLDIGTHTNKNEVSSTDIYTSDFYVSYIDVGQGSSAYIQLPDGKNMLIDGGNTEYGDDVADFLNARGVKTIDYLIATHADSDHIGGLNYVLKHFEFKHIYRPFQIAGKYKETGTSANDFVPSEYDELGSIYDELTSNGIKVYRASTSVYSEFIKNIYEETYTENGVEIKSDITVFYDGLDEISGEDYSFNFFAPLIELGYDSADKDLSVLLGEGSRTKGKVTKCYRVSDSNSSSAIFLFTCRESKFLFTGDAPYTEYGASKTNKNYEEMQFVLSLTDEEKALLSNIDVYTVGHHGSSYSSSSELLNIINPRYVVVSCGAGNSYGHPASDALQRIASTSNLETDYLLRTDKNGDISFAIIEGKLRYYVSKNDNSNLTLSWYILGTVIYVMVAIITLSLKPAKRYNKKH